MEVLNVFIGSTAVRWSEKIKGNKLLLDTSSLFNKNVLSPCSFPSNQTKDIVAYNHKFNLLKKDYKEYIELFIDDMDCWDFYTAVKAELIKYNHVNIIVAAGGLFGNTFTPIILSYIEYFHSANIYIQKTNFKFLVEKEQLLIDYINKEFNIEPIIISIKNIHQKFKDITLDKVLLKLDTLAIDIINSESENRNLNLKFKDLIHPTKKIQGNIITAEDKVTKKGTPFGILSIQLNNNSETFFMFDEEYEKYKDFYIVGKNIVLSGVMKKEKWILKEDAKFKITEIEWVV